MCWMQYKDVCLDTERWSTWVMGGASEGNKATETRWTDRQIIASLLFIPQSACQWTPSITLWNDKVQFYTYLEGLHIREQRGRHHSSTQLGAQSIRSKAQEHSSMFLKPILCHGRWLLGEGDVQRFVGFQEPQLATPLDPTLGFVPGRMSTTGFLFIFHILITFIKFILIVSFIITFIENKFYENFR